MSLLEPDFGKPTLLVSRVSYLCDLRTGLDRIPLGVFAQFKSQSLFGLGLMARVSLSEDEKAKLAPLARVALSSPFEMLCIEYDRVWEAPNKSEAFGNLITNTGSSIVFGKQATISLSTYKNFLLSGDKVEKIALAQDILDAQLKESYWAFMAEFNSDHAVSRDQKYEIAA
jgi:hypothetical protein